MALLESEHGLSVELNNYHSTAVDIILGLGLNFAI